MAYSDKINDPAFDKYLKNTKDYRFIFAFALAVIAVAGFYIYGATSDEMDNPEALYIGLGIGGMFLLIGIHSVRSLRAENSWDGEIFDKRIVRQKGKIRFIVFVKDHKGQLHEITSENDATLYDYYRIGEAVRYHGKLKTYEKFDKSKDDIIFCNACSFINEPKDEMCINCHCPLLK